MSIKSERKKAIRLQKQDQSQELTAIQSESEVIETYLAGNEVVFRREMCNIAIQEYVNYVCRLVGKDRTVEHAIIGGWTHFRLKDRA
jgi:exo-beta-1,3-glucanase (GH17 family)